MKLPTYSQAGQDQWAWGVANRKKDGTFLDYGCNHPFIHSNTAWLEAMGWEGICIDIGSFDYSNRKALFLQRDGTTRISEVLDFCKKWEGYIDYLSIDVDDATIGTLKAIPFDECKFGAITLEHDSYRIGRGVKDWAYGFLHLRGYDLAREDVKAPKTPGMPWSEQPFEDWYVPMKR